MNNIIYSNFDHWLNEDQLKDLIENKGVEKMHSAWNFCGYITYENGVFKEEVWRHRVPIDTLTNKDINLLIQEVNEKYGRG